MRMSYWSSDVCSSDLAGKAQAEAATQQALAARGLADLRAAESRAKEAAARLSARLEALEAERTTHARRVRDMEDAAVALAADLRREASLAGDVRLKDTHRVGKEGLRKISHSWL